MHFSSSKSILSLCLSPRYRRWLINVMKESEFKEFSSFISSVSFSLALFGWKHPPLPLLPPLPKPPTLFFLSCTAFVSRVLFNVETCRKVGKGRYGKRRR